MMNKRVTQIKHGNSSGKCGEYLLQLDTSLRLSESSGFYSKNFMKKWNIWWEKDQDRHQYYNKACI